MTQWAELILYQSETHEVEEHTVRNLTLLFRICRGDGVGAEPRRPPAGDSALMSLCPLERRWRSCRSSVTWYCKAPEPYPFSEESENTDSSSVTCSFSSSLLIFWRSATAEPLWSFSEHRFRMVSRRWRSCGRVIIMIIMLFIIIHIYIIYSSEWRILPLDLQEANNNNINDNNNNNNSNIPQSTVNQNIKSI